MENELIIYNTDDGKADVKLYSRDGVIWMSQQQMALLFDTSKQNISLHILNILQDKELYEKSVVKDYLTTAGDGKNYNITYSCGGFNTPTLCVVTKGIKAECNHLMRTTYPDACVGVVDYALPMVIAVGFRVRSIRGTQFRRWANALRFSKHILRCKSRKIG